ncbi:MAG TPA: MBL fold metallo-hydrolase, partial [Patescibacteria group bacterium]|nr:MBL fold metallo-hydrolase [Patescibacteria group bacterium]
MRLEPRNVVRIAASAALLALAARIAFPDPRLSVTVFDVGQGDAILVQCGRRQLLIDGGPDATVLSGLGRAMPFFDRDIDAVVLTHPHADHFIGLVSVLARYRVHRLLVSRMEGEAPEFAAFADAASRAGLAPVRIRAGDRVAIGDCGSADVLWPEDDRA